MIEYIGHIPSGRTRPRCSDVDTLELKPLLEAATEAAHQQSSGQREDQTQSKDISHHARGHQQDAADEDHEPLHQLVDGFGLIPGRRKGLVQEERTIGKCNDGRTGKRF